MDGLCRDLSVGEHTVGGRIDRMLVVSAAVTVAFLVTGVID
jgi:hypothetical protein